MGVWDQCFSRDGIRSRPSLTKNPLRCSGLCTFRAAALINNSVPWADVTSSQYGHLKWCCQKCSLVRVTLVGGCDTIPVHSRPATDRYKASQSLKRSEEHIVSQCSSMTKTQPLTRGSKLVYHRAQNKTQPWETKAYKYVLSNAPNKMTMGTCRNGTFQFRKEEAPPPFLHL